MKTLLERRAQSMSHQHRTRSRPRQQPQPRQNFDDLFKTAIEEAPEQRELLSIRTVRFEGLAKDRDLFFVSRRDNVDLSTPPLGVYRIELPKTKSRDNKRKIMTAFRRVYGEHILTRSWLAFCDYSRAETFESLTDLKYLAVQS